MSGEPLVVFYDGECRWCRWSVARLVPFDRRRRLRLAPIQGPEGDRLLASVPESERLESAHAVTADGQVFSGGDAAAPIAGELPALAWTVPLLRAAPGVTRSAYRAIADRRSLLGGRLSDSSLRRADELIAQRSA